MTKEEILKKESWDRNDPRSGIAAFATFLCDTVGPWDAQPWIVCLAEKSEEYKGWEDNSRIVSDFISDMLF